LDFCPNYNKVAWSRNQSNFPGESESSKRAGAPKRGAAKPPVLFTRLRCKRWDCEYCAAKNQAIWRAFLHKRLPEVSEDWWLMTLTAHSQQRSQAESYMNLQHGIDVLMKRMRRVFGGFQYVRSYEKHPTSEALHAHFIISDLSPFVVHGVHRNHVGGFLPVLERPYKEGCWKLSTYVKNEAHASKMGYIADVQPLQTKWAVFYVTKYLTKAAQQIDIKGLRHVQTTQAIGSPSYDSLLHWHVGDYVTARDFLPGDAIMDMQTRELLDADYWNDNDVYPPVLT